MLAANLSTGPSRKVFVISLPRCATVSMTSALAALGIRLAHLGRVQRASDHEQSHYHVAELAKLLQKCESHEYDFELLASCDGLSDYPACIPAVVEGLDRAYPGSLFINVRRDDNVDAWLQSVERQFVGRELLAQQNHDASLGELAAIMRRFRELTFGAAEFDATQYASAYRSYQRWVDAYFESRTDLLEFNDAGQLPTVGYERLAHFLGVPKIDAEFPRDNSHSREPADSFYQALRQGRIVSQTGITPLPT